jgi:hypothetical protein
MERCQLHEENISLKIKGVEAHVKALIEIQENQNAFSKERLNAILEQTIKTNGRVSECENNLVKLNFWKWLIEKPYRLVVGIISIVMISKLITNEQIIDMIIKLFT